jgi:hypothetical protein
MEHCPTCNLASTHPHCEICGKHHFNLCSIDEFYRRVAKIIIEQKYNKTTKIEAFNKIKKEFQSMPYWLNEQKNSSFEDDLNFYATRYDYSKEK